MKPAKHADHEKFGKACLCDQLHSAGLCGGSLGSAQSSLPGIQRLLVLQGQAPVAWAPQREGMALRRRRPNARTAILTRHERHSGHAGKQIVDSRNLEGNLNCIRRSPADGNLTVAQVPVTNQSNELMHTVGPRDACVLKSQRARRMQVMHATLGGLPV